MTKDWSDANIEVVSAGQLRVGDVVTIRNAPRESRIELIRERVPGVVWIYLFDPETRSPMRHVALPVNEEVLRH